MSPHASDVLPRIDLTCSKIDIDGYQGSTETWESFGKYIALLNSGRDEVTPVLGGILDEITSGVTGELDKVNIVYRYLQENFRYVSIQLGIGGWQTFSCGYVDTNKFGDCKALSNYMKSCLGYLGIDSYYTIINATAHISYPEDYFTNKFNHAILYVPGVDKWYECTSKNNPPGYLGVRNSNKEVLSIIDGKGVRQRTPAWSHEESIEDEKIKIVLSENGDAEFTADLKYLWWTA